MLLNRFLVLLGLLPFSSCVCVADTSIEATSLAREVKVVGLTEKALGSILQLTGSVEYFGIEEIGDLQIPVADIIVGKIDDDYVEKPFRLRLIDPMPGDGASIPENAIEITIIGYESGSFVGIPEEGTEYLPFYEPGSFHFQHSFVLLKVITSKGKIEAQ